MFVLDSRGVFQIWQSTFEVRDITNRAVSLTIFKAVVMLTQSTFRKAK